MINFDKDTLRMKNGIYYAIIKKELGDAEKFGFKPFEYHNGYIFLNKRKDTKLLEKIIIENVEVTCNTEHSCFGENYRVLGFDTAHYYNFINPETQTYNAVESVIYEIFEKYNKEFYGTSN